MALAPGIPDKALTCTQHIVPTHISSACNPRHGFVKLRCHHLHLPPRPMISALQPVLPPTCALLRRPQISWPWQQPSASGFSHSSIANKLDRLLSSMVQSLSLLVDVVLALLLASHRVSVSFELLRIAEWPPQVPALHDFADAQSSRRT